MHLLSPRSAYLLISHFSDLVVIEVVATALDTYLDLFDQLGAQQPVEGIKGLVLAFVAGLLDGDKLELLAKNCGRLQHLAAYLV